MKIIRKFNRILLMLPILMIGSGLTAVSQSQSKFIINGDQLKQIRLLEANESHCRDLLILNNREIDTLKSEIVLLKGLNMQLEKQNELNMQIISERTVQYNSCKNQKQYYLEETIRLNKSNNFKKVLLGGSVAVNIILMLFVLK